MPNARCRVAPHRSLTHSTPARLHVRSRTADPGRPRAEQQHGDRARPASRITSRTWAPEPSSPSARAPTRPPRPSRSARAQLIALTPTARPPTSAPKKMRQSTPFGAAWTVIPTANDSRHNGGSARGLSRGGRPRSATSSWLGCGRITIVRIREPHLGLGRWAVSGLWGSSSGISPGAWRAIKETVPGGSSLGFLTPKWSAARRTARRSV